MNHERPNGFKFQPQETLSLNNFPPLTHDCLEVVRIILGELDDTSKLAGNEIQPQLVFVQAQTNISESRRERSKLQDWLEANTHDITLR